MMKRILSLMLAALMLLALMPARAEEGIPEQLYRIVLRTEEGDETLGTGVLFGTNTALLTAEACWAEGSLYAIGQDGEHRVSYRGEVMGSHLITLGLATPSAAQPLTVTTADYLLDYMLYGASAAGSFVRMALRNSRTTAVNNRAEALLYAQEGLLPGAIMLGNDQGLACVTLWQEAEGEGVYTCVADVTLTALFGTEGDASQPRLLEGFTARYEAGEIHVDWSGAMGYTLTEDTVFSVYCTTEGNNYFSRDLLESGETSTSFPAIPETEVMVWVSASQGEPEELLYPEYSSQVQFVSVPEALPFTLYGHRNLRMGVTCAEPGLDGMATDFLPQQPLTRENLTNPDLAIYFQTEDAYSVSQEDDAHTLMVSLYTPEGCSFCYHSGYVFMPEFNESDLWLSDITAVFEDYERFCEGEPWPAGEYTVLYTIDGGEVAHITFTLE